MRKFLSVVAAGSLLAGCADAGNTDPRGFDGPGVEIVAAPLTLSGVEDVVWDLQVVNTTENAGSLSIVWNQRISSSQYGNGSGSASYVGPCDASRANAGTPAHNEVRVWVVGIYGAAVASPGTFDYGRSIPGTPLPFQNPTTKAPGADGATVNAFSATPLVGDGYGDPLDQSIICNENQDAFVQFDVALMRPAQQGFFDIAVNFNNIFCSAKFDCAYADTCAGTYAQATNHCVAATTTLCNDDSDCPGADTCDNAGADSTAGTCAINTSTACNGASAAQANVDCDYDIDLLFARGARAKTFVLGFACTAGVDASTQTELFMDDIELSCDAADTFATTTWGANAVTVSVDNNTGGGTPSPIDGNYCTTAGSYGITGVEGTDWYLKSGCTGITNDSATAPLLYQAASYRGAEQLTNRVCAGGANSGLSCDSDTDCPSSTCGAGTSLNKYYWNIALGMTAHSLTGCRLRTKGTANDKSDDAAQTAAGTGITHDSVAISDDFVYPYVLWNVSLDSCRQQPLTFSDTAMVRVKYSQIDTPDTAGDQFGNTFPLQ